jgi:L,D-peptidoglycan transpeptidase YkuD (ErfK/YbiS/YcfS/YnhG family)
MSYRWTTSQQDEPINLVKSAAPVKCPGARRLARVLLLVALIAVAAPIPAETRQVLLSLAATWDAPAATLKFYERKDAKSPWRARAGAVPVSLGRAGLAWGRGLHPLGLDGPTKREGDGRSPAGVFDLRSATGYAPEPLPGSKLPYRSAGPTLRCVDDPGSKHYNSLVDEAETPRDWTSAEDMRRPDELYRWVVWVGHNDAPAVPGAGSCIFLHLRRAPDAVTAGCTAFDGEALERVLRALDPAARPVLVQLPQAEWQRLRGSWGLPE